MDFLSKFSILSFAVICFYISDPLFSISQIHDKFRLIYNWYEREED